MSPLNVPIPDNHIAVGNIVVRVKDDGAGMSEDQIAALFQEGVQFDANNLQAGQGHNILFND